ncbi:hypothetical protein PRIPAC_96878 [Pristionchus pacificus]|uniref:Uncharacterized protein n=1 Tax=Pristionchus pacificus TaxID=54126 RepID=A0A454Y3I1_PRIPA|nr:hypothetical protein PRIPAC_96878 [Pristionchus pacificus]|eukprot:PDM81761.1 hypothetical protein PRIPAC_37603 [Pristionchus pacificus]
MKNLSSINKGEGVMRQSGSSAPRQGVMREVQETMNEMCDAVEEEKVAKEITSVTYSMMSSQTEDDFIEEIKTLKGQLDMMIDELMSVNISRELVKRKRHN